MEYTKNNLYLYSIKSDSLKDLGKEKNKFNNIPDADWKTFQKCYDQNFTWKAWLGRKVMILPKIVWQGIIKTIYHLGYAIILCIDRNNDHNRIPRKLRFYHLIRDWQLVLVHIYSIFRDQAALWHTDRIRLEKLYCHIGVKSVVRIIHQEYIFHHAEIIDFDEAGLKTLAKMINNSVKEQQDFTIQSNLPKIFFEKKGQTIDSIFDAFESLSNKLDIIPRKALLHNFLDGGLEDGGLLKFSKKHLKKFSTPETEEEVLKKVYARTIQWICKIKRSEDEPRQTTQLNIEDDFKLLHEIIFSIKNDLKASFTIVNDLLQHVKTNKKK